MKGLSKIACVICNKIFDQCKFKEHIPKVEIPLNNVEKNNIRFGQGFIFNDTLCIYDIKDRPDFKRAIFEIGIPFQVKAQKGVVYKGLISNIKRDIVLFMPNFQGNKFNLKLKIETSSRLLGDVIHKDNKSYFYIRNIHNNNCSWQS
jgi:hypothetical protein